MRFFAEFASLTDLLDRFPTENHCITFLEANRWPDTVISPFDELSTVYKCAGFKYKCKNTGKYFNVRTGTIFDNSKISLKKWFVAIYLHTSHKKGISSHQLARDLGITQKSAWFVLHRIRHAFNDKSVKQALLTGIVEVDEVYIGGDDKNKHASKRSGGTGMEHKTPVIGIKQRGGDIVLKQLNKAYGTEIKPIVKNIVSKDSMLITDGFGAYTGLSTHFKFHEVVNHSAHEYVRGIVHTNTIECFFSLLNRTIYGTYHYVSNKHLQQYLNEIAYRANTIKYSEAGRFNDYFGKFTVRLTYAQLISNEKKEAA